MNKEYTTKSHSIFESFVIGNEMLRDMSEYPFPTRLHTWKSSSSTPYLKLKEKSTFYGFVYTGGAQVKTTNNTYNLKEGQYFCFTDEIEIEGGSGIIIEAMNCRGLDMLGGPIEEQGRLRYVDGCTDSLLVCPVRLGDPCLNALFFPPMTDQTQHTHPSIRIGIVVKGRGECVIPGEIIPLTPGVVFIIHEDGLHKFRTAGDQSMTVVAYHPDSDYGPKDDDHPMINRTIVEGVSAAKRSDIHTKEI